MRGRRLCLYCDAIFIYTLELNCSRIFHELSTTCRDKFNFSPPTTNLASSYPIFIPISSYVVIVSLNESMRLFQSNSLIFNVLIDVFHVVSSLNPEKPSTVVIVFVIPGLTGLVSVLVLSYVFFGMFFLVDDMDRPLDYSNDSLIQANLEPLEEFIDNHKIL